MNTITSDSQSTEKPGATGLTPLNVLLRIGIFTVFLAAIMFLAAGGLDWAMGWVYVAVNAGVLAVSAFTVPLDAELVEERTQIKEDVKAWDKVIATILSVMIPLGIPVLAGLDVRFGWSPQIALWIQILALVPFALGNGLSFWAAATNKFFARYVRIQKERGHTVVTGGPYRYVRHPGYVGGIITMLAVALALGSLWTLILGGLLALLTVIRTALEDRTLQEELYGYKEYAQRVRYRLLPGIW